MHLLILGATGKSGDYAYKYALQQGHDVTVLVRDASRVKPQDRLTILEGSVLSDKDMDRAFIHGGGHIDAVLQFLNPHRASSQPWAKFLGPPRLLADATANAARALRNQYRQDSARGKSRLVAMNALGAGASRQVTPFITRFFIDYSNVGKTYKDHEAVDAEIEQICGDDIRWTIALAVGLGDAGVKPVKTLGHLEGGAGWMITRESCARWMIDVALGNKDDQFSNKRVIVSN